MGSLISTLSAQAPVIQWQRALGGNGWDEARSIAPTIDGGYIVAGYTNSTNGDVSTTYGSRDYWVVKLDASGGLQWQKTLGGFGTDQGTSIAPTNDGGYIVAGYTDSASGDVTNNHGDFDYWVVKLDASGTLLWQRTLGGTFWEEARSIAPTTDGGCIVAGMAESADGDVTNNHGGYDTWVVKLDATGTIQWQRALGGSGYEEARSIATTTDGGYIVAGFTESVDGDVTNNHGEGDCWVVKLDASGTLLWQRTLGGSSSDFAHSIVPATEGGYIVAGWTTSTDGDVTNNHGGYDTWVVKLDATGTMQWQKTFGGSDIDWATSITPTTDGGYVVAGITGSTDGDVTNNNGDRDYWVLKLDSSGTLQWQKTLGGSDWEEAHSIAATNDGGYIVAGFTYSTDGDVTNHHGGEDFWVVKLIDSGVGIDQTGSPDLSISVFPNPANGSFLVQSDLTHATWVLTDALGRNVLDAPVRANTQTLHVSHIPRGLYFLTLRSDQGTHTQRVVLE